MSKVNCLIMGAAGRDFHNFNVYFRQNESLNVVAFTATQIPNIDSRKYPAELSGKLYPEGIPIHPEDKMEELVKQHNVRDVYFSYSDVSYQTVMEKSARVHAVGATFILLGPNDTMIKSTKPVISICASRTGCGKSQTSRRIMELLLAKGLKPIAVRHPMPYDNRIADQAVQRFAEIPDLKKHRCTIEEMEEYEPHIARGNVIYAGADYEAILRAAEKDPLGCDVVVWDGGNNDWSFFKPDLAITVLDPHRAGDEGRYFPGEVNVRQSDVLLINKIDSAGPEDIQTVRDSCQKFAPGKPVIEACSILLAKDPAAVRGKRVLAVEDGPTCTHGGMKIGAATLAAQKWGCSELVDPRPFLVGELADTFKKYPNIGKLLPAMGYGEKQLADLTATIQACDADMVLIGTPIDLTRIVDIKKPHMRVSYELAEVGKPDLAGVMDDFCKTHNLEGKK